MCHIWSNILWLKPLKNCWNCDYKLHNFTIETVSLLSDIQLSYMNIRGTNKYILDFGRIKLLHSNLSSIKYKTIEIEKKPVRTIDTLNPV